FLCTRDGRRLETSSAIAPLRDSTGAVCGGLAIIHDVTEQARAQRALQQAEKLALLGGIAHELSNPLAAVVGQAELLGAAAANRADEALGAMAERILDSAVGCYRVVKAFKSLASRGETERRPLALNDVVSDVLGSAARWLRTDRIEVTRALAPELPAL